MNVVFETERLIIRPWTEEDAADAREMYSHPEVLRFLPRRAEESATVETQWAALQKTNQVYADLNDGTGFWAVIEKSSGRAIGSSVLKALPGHEEIEVGWHQNPNFWGKLLSYHCRDRRSKGLSNKTDASRSHSEK